MTTTMLDAAAAEALAMAVSCWKQPRMARMMTMLDAATAAAEAPATAVSCWEPGQEQ